MLFTVVISCRQYNPGQQNFLNCMAQPCGFSLSELLAMQQLPSMNLSGGSSSMGSTLTGGPA